jgi:hypothetical protein
MPGLAVGEDLALCARLTADPDVRIARSTAVRVTTSARRVSRVVGGFASYLNNLDPRPVERVNAGAT